MSTPSRTLSRAALAAALLAIATFACSGDDDQGTGDQGATLPDGSPDGSPAGSPDGSLGTSPDASPDGSASPVIKFVFVVAMENHDADAIIGNTDDAPYINGTLVPSYAM